MENNFEIWDKLRTPPDAAKKKIQAGRLKGMTDIKPQWRFEAMTKAFGPCGIGWRYDIVRTWLEEGADGVVCVFCQVDLYFKHDGEWSEAIPGIGGNTFIAKESRGMYTSDEAHKMALTDALSVAMKAIGVGSDVYMGYSDSKYVRAEDKKDKFEIIDEWEKEADKNADSVDSLGSWYKSKKAAIAKLEPFVKEKVNSYVTQLKNALTEQAQPDTIKCKESGNMVTAEDCKESKCSSTFDKCR